eukprot:6461613-Amphidinium_carterae.2
MSRWVAIGQVEAAAIETQEVQAAFADPSARASTEILSALGFSGFRVPLFKAGKKTVEVLLHFRAKVGNFTFYSSHPGIHPSAEAGDFSLHSSHSDFHLPGSILSGGRKLFKTLDAVLKMDCAAVLSGSARRRVRCPSRVRARVSRRGRLLGGGVPPLSIAARSRGSGAGSSPGVPTVLSTPGRRGMLSCGTGSTVLLTSGALLLLLTTLVLAPPTRMQRLSTRRTRGRLVLESTNQQARRAPPRC